jgi:hypothetical protein
MSQSRSKFKTETDPRDPPPQEEPTHDVPVYPQEDPPPARETAMRAAAADKNEDDHHDVDEDDLDPKKTHTPPDAPKPGVIFDEDEEAR